MVEDRTASCRTQRRRVGTEVQPWHDPEDGRFTFANSGNYHPRGSGGARTKLLRAGSAPKVEQASDDLVITAQRQTVDDVEALSDQEFGAFEKAAKSRRWTARRENAEIHEYVRLKKAVEARRRLEEVGAEDWAQQGRDFGRLYAEEAAMQAAGGAASRFVVAPAVRAAAPRIERLVRPQAYARKLAERTPRPQPETTWLYERAAMKPDARKYNDSAPGIRVDPVTGRTQVPSLYRTMPDGTRRAVRFDGQRPDVPGVFIDKKLNIHGKGSLEQALRQSAALRENNAIAHWQVPTRSIQRRAQRLLAKANIDNIYVTVVPK